MAAYLRLMQAGRLLKEVTRMKLLLTAFEPFNGGTVNPSQMVLEKVEEPHGMELVKIVLPVEFKKTTRLLKELLREHRPDVVISLGQAGNRPEICVERVAVNLDNVRSSDGMREIADNAGEKPVDEPIIPDGETAYFSTLPVWKLVTAIRNCGVKSAVSYSAGTYVCNHVMYTVLQEAACHYPDMKAGFVHVPFLPEQMEGRTNGYAMELEDMIKGVQAIVNWFYEADTNIREKA